jgi:hypothetical protein
MKKTFFTALMLTSLTASFPAAAQEFADDISDFQTWGNITATGNFGFINRDNPTLTKVKWWLEGQGRFGDNSSRFSQALLRPGLGYQINETTSIWAGYAWAPTDYPFVSKAVGPVDEQRVWQQLLWKDKFSFGSVQSRTRLEQRMIPQLGDDVGVRFRELLKLSVPLNFAPGFSYVVQDEVFIALNTNDWIPRRGLDNNRFFTGLGYAFNKNVSTEIGYMNHYIIRRGANLMDHVLSVNLFLNY